MMPNITRGGNTTGLMHYLVGLGRANEHENPHVIAGDSMFEVLWTNQELDHVAASEIAGHLDMFQDTYSVQSYGNVEKYDKATGTKYKVRNKNHVWHCSLSLPPDEGALSEEKWNQIAHEFMGAMGFTEASGKAPCQWVAVHHGSSKNGGDHIHIVANIVREDGTKWYQNRDWPMAQKKANELEHKYGLRVVESREHNRSARADLPTALNEAAKQGQPTTDRARLETRVRAAATSAANETEFIERLSSTGVRVRPRFAAGRSDVVTGYSVALHTRPGQQTQWFGGGRLARDLTLDRLRRLWPSSPQSADQAVTAWTEHWGSGKKNNPALREASMEEWRGNAQGLNTVLQGLRAIDPTNPHALADATTNISGLLSTMALRHRDTEMGHSFDFTARQIGKHGQTKRRPPVDNQRPTFLTLTAQLMMTAAMTRGSRSNELVLFMQTIQLTTTLANLYRQANQTNTAFLIERDTKSLFDQVHRQFGPRENQLLHELAGTTLPLQENTLPSAPPPPAQDSALIQEAQAALATPELATATTTPTSVPRRSRLPGLDAPVDLTPRITGRGRGPKRPDQTPDLRRNRRQ